MGVGTIIRFPLHLLGGFYMTEIVMTGALCILMKH